MGADAPQWARTSTALGRRAGPQRPSRGGVLDVDRREAALVIVRVGTARAWWAWTTSHVDVSKRGLQYRALLAARLPALIASFML
jgi:hypothetical protein